jgi:hypothetical protein
MTNIKHQPEANGLQSLDDLAFKLNDSIMDISKTYFNEKKKKDSFGRARLLLNNNDRLGTPDRHHASLAGIEGDSKDLNKGEALFQAGIGEYRYILSKNITFDIFISLYDVDNKSFAGFRTERSPDEVSMLRFLEESKKRKMRNIEMRVYGMQDNDASMAQLIERIIRSSKASLVEVDIFGKEVRNLAFDLKTGMVFNLLLLNRIYRPGELANKEVAGIGSQVQLKFNPG